MDFVDVAQESVLVIDRHNILQFPKGVRSKFAHHGILVRVQILVRHRWKTFETVESVNAPSQIRWLEDSAQVRPRHETEAMEHAALDDGAFGLNHLLEHFIERDET